MLRVLTSYWKIKIRKYLAPKKYIRHFVVFLVIWYCFNLFIKSFPKGYILSGGTIWVVRMGVTEVFVDMVCSLLPV